MLEHGLLEEEDWKKRTPLLPGVRGWSYDKLPRWTTNERINNHAILKLPNETFCCIQALL